MDVEVIFTHDQNIPQKTIATLDRVMYNKIVRVLRCICTNVQSRWMECLTNRGA